MAEEILLSFIVPVYRVEPYLRQCLDSILAQNLDEARYEVVMVDDGSPDGCPAICDAYAAARPNFVVIHKANGGLSSARNAAMKVARGRYVFFVDSDDFLLPQSVGRMLDIAMAHSLQMMVFSYIKVEESAEASSYEPPRQDSEPVFGSGLEVFPRRYEGMAVQYIVDRQFLLGTGLTFSEGHLMEDSIYTLELTTQARKAGFVDVPCYCYRFNSDSILHNKALERQPLLVESHTWQVEQLKRYSDTYSGQFTPDYARYIEEYIALSAYVLMKRSTAVDMNAQTIRRLKAAGVYPAERPPRHKAPSRNVTVLHRIFCRPALAIALGRALKLLGLQRWFLARETREWSE